MFALSALVSAAGAGPRVVANGVPIAQVRQELASALPAGEAVEVLNLSALAVGAPLRTVGGVRLVPCRGVAAPADLRTAAAAALEDTLNAEEPAALLEIDAALARVPCAREIVALEEVVRLHYLRGVALYGRWERTGEREYLTQSEEAFRAARTLYPSLAPDEATFGADLNDTFWAADPQAPVPLRVLPPPQPPGRILLDGLPFAAGPDPVPVARGEHLLQIVGPTVATAVLRLDDEGAVMVSAFVTSELASWVARPAWHDALDLLLDAYTGPVDWIVGPEGSWSRAAAGWEWHPPRTADPGVVRARRRRLTTAGVAGAVLGATLLASGWALSADAAAWGRAEPVGTEREAYRAARGQWVAGEALRWTGAGLLAGGGAAVAVARLPAGAAP